MADRELNTILNSGEILSIHLGGTSSDDTVLTKGEIETLIEASKPPAEAIEIFGESSASTQEPTATDTPLQIEFGTMQSSSNVTLSADGSVTFTTEGEYHVSTLMHFGRSGGGGEAELFIRKLINGVVSGSVEHVTLDDTSFAFPHGVFQKQHFNQGDVLTYEIMRDSAGNNSGGLFARIPTLAGWNTAPTASITIIKHED